jgi:SAM-dependent methyltransferase
MSVQRYLKRMDASIDDKLKVVEYIPEDADYVLDVGCAAGGVTRRIAQAVAPDNIHVHGIDINLPFVGMAQQTSAAAPNTPNVSFSHNWLSDLLKYDTKYDAVLFMSVLHEFYSSGGTTAVVKALSDAHDLLKPGGRIIIRDMIRPDNALHYSLDVGRDRFNIMQKWSDLSGLIASFELQRGGINQDVTKMNELLLHLLYSDNWSAEMKETYLFWSHKDYAAFLGTVLGMHHIRSISYLTDYVRDKWERMGVENDVKYYSNGIVVYERI